MDQTEKNAKIRESFLATKARRKDQVCRVFQLKIDRSSLHSTTIETLNGIFREAKWAYNYLVGLSGGLPRSIDFSKTKELQVKNKDGEFEPRKLEYLKSSQLEGVLIKAQWNIKALSALKKAGYQIGRLKFKSEVNSLLLKQYGITHKIVSPTKVKIQGIKQKLRVRGLKQILSIDGIELTTANLIRKGNDFYLQISTFISKENLVSNQMKNNDSIGIDFGIKNSFTLSDGRVFDYSVEESEHQKRLQQKLARQKKGSNNRRKTIIKLRRCYDKQNNKKNDYANKFVHQMKAYKRICIQDEQLNGWKTSKSKKRNRVNSKVIQHSVLGRVKAKLKLLPQTVVLDRYIPTTKWCCKCGSTTETPGSEFRCNSCKDSGDRDVHAAQNMKFILDNFVPVGRRDFKLVEFAESVRNTYGIASKCKR